METVCDRMVKFEKKNWFEISGGALDQSVDGLPEKKSRSIDDVSQRLIKRRSRASDT